MYGVSKYIPKTKSNVDQALEFISDPSIRATLQIEIANAKKLRTENSNLRAAFTHLSAPISTNLVNAPSFPSYEGPVEIAGTISPPTISDNAEITITASKPCTGLLSRYQIAILKEGIDAKRIRKEGFKVSEDGSVRNLRDDILLPPGFINAIETVIAAIGQTFSE